jgi:hypothetical protein
MSILQALIPDPISGQKYCMNVGLILSIYRDMGIWNVASLANELWFILFIYLMEENIVQFGL